MKEAEGLTRSSGRSLVVVVGGQLDSTNSGDGEEHVVQNKDNISLSLTPHP